MDARAFLGMEPVDDLRWRMNVRRDLSTPEGFLFGGCGLGAALIALEAAADRPTIWASGHYLSYAPTDSTVEWEVTLAAVGRHVTHGRAVGRVEGREILTVNASLGIDKLDVEGIWIEPPEVPAPDECPPRALPVMFRDSINERVELRAAKGRHFEEIGGTPGPPGPPDSALWARLPEHIFPSAAVLAIVGDFIPGAMSQPIGQRAMARSLDNTLRVVQFAATEWVLCDIRIHALAGGYGHGTAFLWSEDGDLLAIASQSIGVRLWSEDSVQL